MKRILRTIFSLAILMTGVLRAQEVPNLPDTKDDPKARDAYEHTLLRNPATGSIPALIRPKELKFAESLPDKEAIAFRKRMDGLVPDAAPPITWDSRGPYNIGGRTRSLGIDIDDESVVIAGGVSGSMWRTSNGGATWVNTSNPASLHNSTCLVQDTRPGQRDTWYYGTGEITGNSAGGSGGA